MDAVPLAGGALANLGPGSPFWTHPVVRNSRKLNEHHRTSRRTTCGRRRRLVRRRVFVRACAPSPLPQLPSVSPYTHRACNIRPSSVAGCLTALLLGCARFAGSCWRPAAPLIIVLFSGRPSRRPPYIYIYNMWPVHRFSDVVHQDVRRMHIYGPAV